MKTTEKLSSYLDQIERLARQGADPEELLREVRLARQLIAKEQPDPTKRNK